MERMVSNGIDKGKYFLSTKSNNHGHIYGLLVDLDIPYEGNSGNDTVRTKLNEKAMDNLDELLDAGMKVRKINFLGFDSNVWGRELKEVRYYLDRRRRDRK
jgi:hypothetical protein